MSRKPGRYDAVHAIECRLCKKSYKAINWSHLKAKHGMGEAYAVEDYKKRFAISRTRCLDSEMKRRRSYIGFLKREGKLWTKERVLKEIRRRRAKGLPINHGAVAKTHSGEDLRSASLRIFKTWDRALTAAGFDPWEIRQSHRWTKKTLVRELRSSATGKVFIPENVPAKRYRRLYRAACSFFGSWSAAVQAAGLKAVRTPRRNWTKREAFARIRERARQGLGVAEGDVLEQESSLYWAVRRLTGMSWTRAIQHLGFRGRVVLWDKELLKQELRRWHRTGKTRLPGISRVALQLAANDWFGSWWKALEAAGVRPRSRPPVRWTRAEVLKRLRRRCREGKSMSWRAVLNDEKRLYRATRRFLGKPWTEVMRDMGWDGRVKQSRRR